MGFFEPNNAVKQTGNHRDLYGTNREKPIKLRLSNLDFSGRASCHETAVSMIEMHYWPAHS